MHGIQWPLFIYQTNQISVTTESVYSVHETDKVKTGKITQTNVRSNIEQKMHEKWTLNSLKYKL